MEKNSTQQRLRDKIKDYIPFYGIYNYQLRTGVEDLNLRLGLLIVYSGMFSGLILTGLEKLVN